MSFENSLSFILVLLGLYEAVIGFLGLRKGEVYQDKKVLEDEYTPESIKAYAKPYGLALLLIGLSIAMINLVYVLKALNVISWAEGSPLTTVLFVLTVVILALGIVMITLARKKYLVKKKHFF